MQKLLSPNEFISRAMGMPGVPWVRWRSDWQACDCYGLVLLWLREVQGVDLGEVPQTSLAEGLASDPSWVECATADPGATMWMAWVDGAPRHCGIVLPGGRVLHSEGSDEKPGGVRVSRLTAVLMVYGEARYYKRAPAC